MDRCVTRGTTLRRGTASKPSPLQGLKFDAVRVKVARAAHIRDGRGGRPSVEVEHPDVRIYVHLTAGRIVGMAGGLDPRSDPPSPAPGP